MFHNNYIIVTGVLINVYFILISRYPHTYDKTLHTCLDSEESWLLFKSILFHGSVFCKDGKTQKPLLVPNDYRVSMMFILTLTNKVPD